jgi:hypothetical protein
VFVYHRYQLLNAWTSLYETWCVYRGTWAHPNGVIPVSLCVCMCVPSIVAAQEPGKHIPAATNTRKNRRIVGRVVFYTVRVVS